MRIPPFVIILVLGIGIGIGFFADHIITSNQNLKNSESLDAHQVRQGGYSLINPLLDCELGGDQLSKQFVSFRYSIESEVNKLKSSGQVDTMAVYFRDLNNGLGLGVNETVGFTPASLLKLPVMITYYKQAEADPTLFKKKYKFTEIQDRNSGETVKPRLPMIFNQEYSVEDLLYRMIVFSDNNAMALLVENMPIPIQDKAYTDLGITVPGIRGTEDFMSVAEYASFFRILYNASYLSKDSSQNALALLTKVDFADGIRAGVPKGVPVANKFGERSINGVQQLHDCGIIYYRNHPYLLCVMSRGTDFSKQAASIKDISRLIYQEVNKQLQL